TIIKFLSIKELITLRPEITDHSKPTVEGVRETIGHYIASNIIQSQKNKEGVRKLLVFPDQHTGTSRSTISTARSSIK
ncbi:hypothetical protein BgiBS90_019254, partial [Biomphalaria glabrata]